jgi:hypothetical protein
MKDFLKLAMVLCALGIISHTPLYASEAIPEDLINSELQRATTDPDSAVTFTVDRSPDEVFDFLINRLAEYSEEVVSASLDHSKSSTGELAMGSDRIVNLTDGSMLVHHFLQVQRPESFAYITDMSRSTADIPIDYSIVHYDLQDAGNGQTTLKVAATYKSRSSLLSMFVRMAFDSALEADFGKAQELLAAQ